MTSRSKCHVTYILRKKYGVIATRSHTARWIHKYVKWIMSFRVGIGFNCGQTKAGKSGYNCPHYDRCPRSWSCRNTSSGRALMNNYKQNQRMQQLVKRTSHTFPLTCLWLTSAWSLSYIKLRKFWRVTRRLANLTFDFSSMISFINFQEKTCSIRACQALSAFNWPITQLIVSNRRSPSNL